MARSIRGLSWRKVAALPNGYPFYRTLRAQLAAKPPTTLDISTRVATCSPKERVCRPLTQPCRSGSSD